MRTICLRVVLAAVVLVLTAAVVHAESAAPIPEPPAVPLVMERGAMIIVVRTGSPAEEAGLEAGDIIVAVNGIVITSEAQLNKALRLALVARLEVVRRDDARRVRLLAFPKEGELGVQVVMVGPEKAPPLPMYRKWI